MGGEAIEAVKAAERVARESYGRLIAFLAARTHDVAAAEDALAEAFVAALRVWPVEGVPGNPDAWLLRVARRRHIDAVRQWQSRRVADEEPVLVDQVDALGGALDDIPDQRLALMFACAHPAIERPTHAPLILYTEARRSARRGSQDDYIPLEKQNVTLWDEVLIRGAETLLREASAGGPSGALPDRGGNPVRAHCAPSHRNRQPSSGRRAL